MQHQRPPNANEVALEAANRQQPPADRKEDQRQTIAATLRLTGADSPDANQAADDAPSETPELSEDADQETLGEFQPSGGAEPPTGAGDSDSRDDSSSVEAPTPDGLKSVRERLDEFVVVPDDTAWDTPVAQGGESVAAELAVETVEPSDNQAFDSAISFDVGRVEDASGASTLPNESFADAAMDVAASPDFPTALPLDIAAQDSDGGTEPAEDGPFDGDDLAQRNDESPDTAAASLGDVELASHPLTQPAASDWPDAPIITQVVGAPSPTDDSRGQIGLPLVLPVLYHGAQVLISQAIAEAAPELRKLAREEVESMLSLRDHQRRAQMRALNWRR